MIQLPKVYDNSHAASSGRFPQHDGKPKISYSQYTSWISPIYRGAYIAQYFLGVPDDGNIFSDFGSKVGEWFEKGEDLSGDLSATDIETLEQVGRPEGCEYEREIVLDRKKYVIQGFIDRVRPVEISPKKKGLEVIDFKTGGENKQSDYSSEDYKQTTLYSHALTLEGETVAYSGVKLLARKGNGSENHPLRLTGQIIEIPTPYSKKRATDALKHIDDVVEDISKHFQFYQKFFGNN